MGYAEGGVTSGAGSYTIDDTPILEANESLGWDFSTWSGTHLDFLSDPNASIVTVSLSGAPTQLKYDPVFVRETYDVNVTVEGDGSVTFNGSNTLNQMIDSNTTAHLLPKPLQVGNSLNGTELRFQAMQLHQFHSFQRKTLIYSSEIHALTIYPYRPPK